MKSDATLVVERTTAMDMAIEARKDGGLPWLTFDRWMLDLRNQPAWRGLAEKCADYYDGNQLTAQQLDEMEKTGMQPIVANIVRPTVDVVLGMEAKTRQDWRVAADGGKFQDIAEAESAMLMEAERESGADRACSDAYAGQIKAGLHWVEVGKSLDPFEYAYRVRAIHRREIWWDWRAKEPDLSDARWLLRRRWVDVDELLARFKRHRVLIEQIGAGNLMFDRNDLTTEQEYEMLVDAHNTALRTSIDEIEYRNTERRQLCLAEFWYRTWHSGHVIKVGGKVIPVDTKNPMIAAAIVSGKVTPEFAVYSRLRLSWWIGPHRLEDVETKKRRFPYIPFWGFREDRTGIPYGLIRPMLDPQDEYNARRSKLMWLLSAKRVEVDSDALDTDYNDLRDLANEVGRPDAVIIRNPHRKNANALSVSTDYGLATQQFNVMHDAQQLLQQTAGVYQAMMGQQSNASSGLAINSLVEQGATTLAEINDNYRYARRLVGQALLDLMLEDIGDKPYAVEVGEGTRAKQIILNERMPDGSIKNDIIRSKTKVTLSDVPSTPAYRAQQLTMLGELTKSMPPQMQAMIIDFVIEATDLQSRKEMAERIRNGMGIKDPRDMTPEQLKQAEELMQQEQAKKDAMEQITLQTAAAKADGEVAKAEKTAAEAEQIRNENALMDEVRNVSEQLAMLTDVVGNLGARLH